MLSFVNEVIFNKFRFKYGLFCKRKADKATDNKVAHGRSC